MLGVTLSVSPWRENGKRSAAPYVARQSEEEEEEDKEPSHCGCEQERRSRILTCKYESYFWSSKPTIFGVSG